MPDVAETVVPPTQAVENQTNPSPQIPQPGDKPENPYMQTAFEPARVGEIGPGDIIFFTYNKQATAKRSEQFKIHDRQPLLLVLAGKGNYPDRIRGINLHYLTYFDMGSLIEMAHKRLLYQYDQVKSSRYRAIEAFRCYLWNWIIPGSVRKMNTEDIQMKINTIRAIRFKIL